MVKNFIIKIQNSDESTRRLWLFVLSGVTMAVVVSLWVAYLNLTVTRVNAPGNAAGVQVAAKAERRDDPNPLQIFAAGVKIIFEQAKAKLSSTNSIKIQNNQRNFIDESVEAVPATPLP